MQMHTPSTRDVDWSANPTHLTLASTPAAAEQLATLARASLRDAAGMKYWKRVCGMMRE